MSNHPLPAVGASREHARRFTCEEDFRNLKLLPGFSEARIECREAWARMFLLVAVVLLVLTTMRRTLLQRADCGDLLRRVRARRRARTELSLVHSVVELPTQGDDLWPWLDHHCRLNLEVGL